MKIVGPIMELETPTCKTKTLKEARTPFSLLPDGVSERYYWLKEVNGLVISY